MAPIIDSTPSPPMAHFTVQYKSSTYPVSLPSRRRSHDEEATSTASAQGRKRSRSCSSASKDTIVASQPLLGPAGDTNEEQQQSTEEYVYIDDLLDKVKQLTENLKFSHQGRSLINYRSLIYNSAGRLCYNHFIRYDGLIIDLDFVPNKAIIKHTSTRRNSIPSSVAEMVENVTAITSPPKVVYDNSEVFLFREITFDLQNCLEMNTASKEIDENNAEEQLNELQGQVVQQQNQELEPSPSPAVLPPPTYSRDAFHRFEPFTVLPGHLLEYIDFFHSVQKSHKAQQHCNQIISHIYQRDSRHFLIYLPQMPRLEHLQVTLTNDIEYRITRDRLLHGRLVSLHLVLTLPMTVYILPLLEAVLGLKKLAIEYALNYVPEVVREMATRYFVASVQNLVKLRPGDGLLEVLSLSVPSPEVFLTALSPYFTGSLRKLTLHLAHQLPLDLSIYPRLTVLQLNLANFILPYCPIGWGLLCRPAICSPTLATLTIAQLSHVTDTFLIHLGQAFPLLTELNISGQTMQSYEALGDAALACVLTQYLPHLTTCRFTDNFEKFQDGLQLTITTLLRRSEEHCTAVVLRVPLGLGEVDLIGNETLKESIRNAKYFQLF